MSKTFYRLSLRLLPRHRRDRYGDEMRDVFAALAADARRAGAAAVTVLLMKELGGIMRFALRERLGRLSDWQPTGGGWHPLRELRWAWRGVGARGWRAAFVVSLFAVVLAANTVVFSAADAFVFRTVPYGEPDRLAIIQRQLPSLGVPTDELPADVLLQWRQHRDLFAGVHGHRRVLWAYVTADDVTELVGTHAVTPGLFELLGVLPAWGRPFVEEDIAPGAAPVVIVSESLARRLFGTPADAVGRTFPTGRDAPMVVGVMPEFFRFPAATNEIWRPLRLGQEAQTIVRLAPGRRFEEVAAAVEARSAAVASAGPPREGEASTAAVGPMSLVSLAEWRRNDGPALIFAMLAGAAVCLLVLACANVASIEMAAAARQSRAQAIQAALGASRGTLARIGWLEGGLLLAASTAVAIPLAMWGTAALSANLTRAMQRTLANPLDLDYRALAFMLAAAAVALALTSVPGLRRLSRLSVLDALRDDTRVMPVTRTSARTRQVLMAGQIALTVLLLVGGLLYVRTYLSRLGLDRGLDDRGLVTIEISPSRDAPLRGADLQTELLQRLRATPGVRAVARTDSLPPSGPSRSVGRLQIDGRAPVADRLHLARYSVDPAYFDTVGTRIVEGTALSAESPPDEVVVNEAFARRFWPAGSAIGSRFALEGAPFGGLDSARIVGISRDFRQDDPGDFFVMYSRLPADWSGLTFVVRVADEAMLPAVATMVRSIAQRSVVYVETMAARYAALDADKHLAASITSGFGLLAFLIATVGVYAVMAFLVAGRAREIGIRMALGADRVAVQRLVFGSSLRFVGVGAAIGVAAALIASRWIASQLYGVTATDPATYAAVFGLIVTTAALATWVPARRAARIDPALTLKAE